MYTIIYFLFLGNNYFLVDKNGFVLWFNKHHRNKIEHLILNTSGRYYILYYIRNKNCLQHNLISSFDLLSSKYIITQVSSTNPCISLFSSKLLYTKENADQCKWPFYHAHYHQYYEEKIINKRRDFAMPATTYAFNFHTLFTGGGVYMV